MGKPKRKVLTRKEKKLAEKKGLIPSGGGGGGKSELSLSELLDGAQDHLDQYQYEQAQKFIYQALERDPDCTRALELCANLLIEVGGRKGRKENVILQPKFHLLF